MIVPKHAVLMALFFARIGRLRSFQLSRQHWNRSARQSAIRNHALSKPSRPISSICQTSGEKQAAAVAISPELQSCILRFVGDGSLTQDESKSISNALFRSPFGRGIVTSIGTDEIKGVIRTSIDIYLTQKARRRQSGTEEIANPGSYVRSIVKKEVELIGGMPEVPSQQEYTSKEAPENSTAEQIHREDTMGFPQLQELLRLSYIEPNELNESCLHALSHHSTPTIKYALETYLKQKKRREQNDMDKISNPSSYIMALLRNASGDKPTAASTSEVAHVSNVETLDAQRRNFDNILAKRPTQSNEIDSYNPSSVVNETLEETNQQSLENTPHIELECENSPSVDELPVDTVSVAATIQPGVTIEEKVDKQTETETSSSPNAPRNIPRVTMEYVDKCLALLQRLEQSVNTIPGIGPKTAQSLNKLGLFTLRDLLWYFPRSFIDRSVLQRDISNLIDGELGTFVLKVDQEHAKLNTVPCTDEAGNAIDVVFFYRGLRGTNIARAAKAKLCQGDEMIVSGKIKSTEKGYTIFNPDVIETINNATGVLGVQPVYRLNSELSHNKLVKAIDGALTIAEDLRLLPESLPSKVLVELGWPTFVDAIKIAHKPSTIDEAGIDQPARTRLAFEELCIQQAQLALTRWDLKFSGVATDLESPMLRPSIPTWRESPLISKAVQSLPFELTASQMKCLDEIWVDTNSNGRMTRLLQGDVGSGKTVIGYLAGLGCIESRQGGAVALLAPTQLLALQHYQTITDFSDKLLNKNHAGSTINNIQVELLTGSVVGTNREKVLSRLENAGESDAIFLIGTHALVTPDVIERLSSNKSIALSIIDEEQRFGVRQRQAISSCAANTLYMTATPIPRSIGLQGAGLLDVTNLESEPRNVQTTIITADGLKRVVDVLQTKINAGSRAFWVLPRIGGGGKPDDQEQLDAMRGGVMSRYEMLRETLGSERVGFVHGKMNIKDREEELARFADQSSPVRVLVSTTVIEVGIDIPDVNYLIVENAERFGLSALHQLRGRIGRSQNRNLKSHCILLSEEQHVNAAEAPPSSLSRLDVLRETMSGQQIADADFMLRGPGDLMGMAQSGLFLGKAVNPEFHWSMLGAARALGRASSGAATFAATEPSESESNKLLIKKIQSGELTAYYHSANASSESGFALRIMMALFADWNSPGEMKGNTLHAIATLQKLSEVKQQSLADDMVVQKKIVSFLASLSKERDALSSIEASISTTQAESETPALLLDDGLSRDTRTKAQILPLSVSTKRIDLTGRDVLFIVLDVETTGLSYDSDHIIQIAAKVLGSNDEADLFSEYVLPPINVPDKIEELTGITDSFLRYGGYDDALGMERTGAARDFRRVFLDFQAFCEDRANAWKSRNTVMIAHNVKFDKGMLDGELRRLRCQDNSLPSSLSEVFDSSVDSLKLFKDKRMWRSSMLTVTNSAIRPPDTFRLGDIYNCVFGESITNSHNAVGDIQALDRLLSENSIFFGWQHIAHDLQKPFSRVHQGQQ